MELPGELGGLIARSLLDQGKPVRILVRGGSSPDALVKAGAEAVRGDLKDANSLRAACAGADAVITTANSVGRAGDDTVESVDRHGNRNLVESADAAGVRRFLFISALGADTQSPMPFLRAKGETEKRIRDSSMDWTILEPNVFMDIWVPAVVGGPTLSGRPVTLVGEGRRRHSFVARHDVAAYTVAALDRTEAQGQTLLIGGPSRVSWRDVITRFEHELRHESIGALDSARESSSRTAEDYGRPARRVGNLRFTHRHERLGRHLWGHPDPARRLRPGLRHGEPQT